MLLSRLFSIHRLGGGPRRYYQGIQPLDTESDLRGLLSASTSVHHLEYTHFQNRSRLVDFDVLDVYENWLAKQPVRPFRGKSGFISAEEAEASS